MADGFPEQSDATDCRSYSNPEPRRYWCECCHAVLLQLPHELHLCQARECIEQGIKNREERIFEISLSIPTVIDELKEDQEGLSRTIEELEERNAPEATIAQYKSILRSSRNNLVFAAKNIRIDQILQLGNEIRELARRLNRPTFSEKDRRELWERDKKRCYLCHKSIPDWSGDSMHIDHITPRSKGGSDEFHNLRIAHPLCNLKKSDQELSSRRLRALIKELQKTEEEISKERLF